MSRDKNFGSRRLLLSGRMSTSLTFSDKLSPTELESLRRDMKEANALIRSYFEQNPVLPC